MRFFKFGLFFVLFLSLFVFSACLGGSSKEDVTGNGLEFDFSVDDRWINVRQLDYSLDIQNTGKYEIPLSAQNFKLYTIEKSEDSSVDAFTDESVENFYRVLFGDGMSSLTLYQNQERNNVNGILEIEEFYFNDLNNEDLTYVLEASFDYKTQVSNNVIINTGKKEIRVTDTLDQAAPVKVTAINLRPLPNAGGLSVDFTIEDKGPGLLEDKKNIVIKNPQFKIGRTFLSGCNAYVENSDGIRVLDLNNLELNEDNKQVIYSCKGPFDDYDENSDVSVKIEGNFDYSYKITKRGKIQLPERKGENLIN